MGPAIGLIFVFGFFSALSPTLFPTFDNAQLMLRHTAVVGIAALGMTLIIISGGIDLSVGSAIALCTVNVAVLMRAGISPSLAALLAVLGSVVCGLMIGLLVTQLKLPPFVVTLGMWRALRGLALGIAQNNTVKVPNAGTWVGRLLMPLRADNAWMFLPPSVWLMLTLTVLVAAALRYTRLGRHIYAIGSNEQTARLCGVPVERTKLLVYMIAAGFTGLAGLLQFSYLTSTGDPSTANGMELDIIAAVVIGGGSLSGGQGAAFGSFIGALIMTMVANGCGSIDLSDWVQKVVTGLMIVLAVLLDRFRQHRT